MNSLQATKEENIQLTDLQTQKETKIRNKGWKLRFENGRPCFVSRWTTYTRQETLSQLACHAVLSLSFLISKTRIAVKRTTAELWGGHERETLNRVPALTSALLSKEHLLVWDEGAIK